MKSSQIHIQLDGLPLTDAQVKALQNDVEKVVTSHLAKLDLKGDVFVGRPGVFNPEWIGIWIRKGGLAHGPLANLQGSLHQLD